MIETISQVLGNIFAYLDWKELMPLRLVCKDWKREIDRCVDNMSLQTWMSKGSNSKSFSMMKILETFPREAAFFRFCCDSDMERFQTDLYGYDYYDPLQVYLPGSSIMIGSTGKSVPFCQRETKCGSNCTNLNILETVGSFKGLRYHMLDKRRFSLNNVITLNSLEIPLNFVCAFLKQVTNNLQIVTFSNIYVSSALNPDIILRSFADILDCLKNVKIIVLNNAFACNKRKALRSDGACIFGKCDTVQNCRLIPNVEKLVISGGSMDAVECIIYKVGYHLKKLTLVDPFKFHHESIHSSLLTPVGNQIFRLKNLSELVIEIKQIDGDPSLRWNDLARVLTGRLPNLTLLSVILFNSQGNYILYAIALASKFPTLIQLKIFVENHQVLRRHRVLFNKIYRKRDNLLNLKRLSFGSNMLQANGFLVLFEILEMTQNIELLEFESLGFEDENPLHDKAWVQNKCMELGLFERLPCLVLIKAILNGHTVKIKRV